jgi:hypothetical protein
MSGDLVMFLLLAAGVGACVAKLVIAVAGLLMERMADE